MTYEQRSSCLEAKVKGTWNLHNAALKERLDFFISFGSVSGIAGNPGQANYAAANTFLDSFTKSRCGLGLPSAVINLGPVEDFGMLSDDPALLEMLRSAFVRLVNEKELVEGLQSAIQQAQVPYSPEDRISNPCIIGLGTTKSLSDSGVHCPWGRDARFSCSPISTLQALHPPMPRLMS